MAAQYTGTPADYDRLRVELAAMVARFGARRVAEEYVELLWDFSDRAKRDTSIPVKTFRAWRSIACKLGNAVHWQGLEWPS